jgi:hypothetical protein
MERANFGERTRTVRTATITTTLLLTALFAAAAGHAQLWRGPAALEIQAREQKGGPVAGGQVKLVCRSIEPPDGPPPVTLDGKGRAIVSGLAEGKWHLEVSREGYMTYQADLDLSSDRKPKVISTMQLNVPRAVHMMDVWFSRARSVPAPAPVKTVAAAPPPKPAPAPPQPKPVEPQPEPVRPAPQAPAPTPAPAPKPTPAPEAPAAPAPQTAAPVPTPPKPMPSPTPQAPPAAPQPPTVAAPAVPAPTAVRRRSFEDRTCFECKPGEASLSVAAAVTAGEGCGTGVRDLLAQAGSASLPAGCRILRITLPEGARYTGYRYEIQDGTEELDCLAGKDCPGGGRWPLDPVLTKGAGSTTVAAAFESGAGAQRERQAVLTVYYATGKR